MNGQKIKRERNKNNHVDEPFRAHYRKDKGVVAQEKGSEIDVNLLQRRTKMLNKGTITFFITLLRPKRFY